MKARFRVVCIVSLVCILCTLGCEDSYTCHEQTTDPIDISSVIVTPASLYLKGIGTQVDLSAVVTFSNGEVVTGVTDYVTDPNHKAHIINWMSENPFVANFVEPGLLKAVSAGETVVRAAVAKKQSEAEVVVEASGSLDPSDVESLYPLQVAHIEINPQEIVLDTIPSTALLTCTLFYSDNLVQEGINRYYYHPSGEVKGQLVWTSLNEEVATVSSYGIVQAISPGEAIIQVDNPWDDTFPGDEMTVVVTQP